MKNCKTAIITGATSGIGEAIAIRLASQGWRLVITGRRTERLNQLAERLHATFGTDVLPLTFDIRDRRQTELAFTSGLPEAWRGVDLLVNNAGLASGLEPLQEGDFDDWDKMIDTNIRGVLHATRFIAPLMIGQGGGHIVNIGSIAGKEVYPNGVVYCATKHAVDALSKGMRLDFVKYGIKVTQVCPGAVETEFSEVRFHGDKERAAGVYRGFTPLTADDVADVVAYAVGLPDHVCLNDIVVMPKAQATATVTHKVL